MAFFDAKDDVAVSGVVTYISPLATSIDGVAYFDATIALADVPPWIREGLNADVRLVNARKENVVRVPRRFLSEENGIYQAYVVEGEKTTPREVQIGLVGTDGYVVVDLPEGTVLTVPPTDLP